MEPPLPPHTPVALPTSSAMSGPNAAPLPIGWPWLRWLPVVVALAQRHAGAHHLGFLADRGVNGAGDLAALHHLGGALVEETDAQHALLHFQQKVICLVMTCLSLSQ